MMVDGDGDGDGDGNGDGDGDGDGDLIDVTIIVNVLFQKAKDAQAKCSIFTNCRAEKL